MRIAVACIAVWLVAAVGCAPSGEIPSPYQKKADASEWRWSDDEAKLLYCVRHQLKGYEVQIVRSENYETGWAPFMVHITAKGQEVCSFRAHDETVFTQHGDAVFVADFCPIATGCTVVAYDLRARKELWRCELRGNPPKWHSMYRHQVSISVDGGAVLVYGNESNGRYIEYVDAKTGKTVGHKKLPPER